MKQKSTELGRRLVPSKASIKTKKLTKRLLVPLQGQHAGGIARGRNLGALHRARCPRVVLAGTHADRAVSALQCRSRGRRPTLFRGRRDLRSVDVVDVVVALKVFE